MYSSVGGLLSSHYSDLGKTVRCRMIAESVFEISPRASSRYYRESFLESRIIVAKVKTLFRAYWGNKLGLTFRRLNFLDVISE